MDHVRLDQGIPDGCESLLGDELHEVVTLQVDEAVSPSEMDPAHVDAVKQVSGVVSKVPQMQGKMNVGIEGVRYVEDDPLAVFLGSRWHGELPVLNQDRQSVVALEDYLIN